MKTVRSSGTRICWRSEKKLRRKAAEHPDGGGTRRAAREMEKYSWEERGDRGRKRRRGRLADSWTLKEPPGGNWHSGKKTWNFINNKNIFLIQEKNNFSIFSFIWRERSPPFDLLLLACPDPPSSQQQVCSIFLPVGSAVWSSWVLFWSQNWSLDLWFCASCCCGADACFK